MMTCQPSRRLETPSPPHGDVRVAAIDKGGGGLRRIKIRRKRSACSNTLARLGPVIVSRPPWPTVSRQPIRQGWWTPGGNKPPRLGGSSITSRQERSYSVSAMPSYLGGRGSNLVTGGVNHPAQAAAPGSRYR